MINMSETEQLDKLIKRNCESCDYRPEQDELESHHQMIVNQYNEVLDYICDRDDHLVITKSQLDYILYSFQPPFCFANSRTDFFKVFDSIVKCTERTGDIRLLSELYLNFTNRYSPVADSWDFIKTTNVINTGIQKLLMLKSFHNAGKLYFGLVQYGIKEKINSNDLLDYCTNGLKYIDKSTLEYAYGISLKEFLQLEINTADKTQSFANFFSFGINNDNGQVTLYASSCMLANGFALNGLKQTCVPILNGKIIKKGYNYCSKPVRIIADTNLKKGISGNNKDELTYVSEKVKVKIFACDKTFDCRVWSHRQENCIVESYFADNIGIVRVLVKYNDGKEYDYDLYDFNIKGGSGLLPLEIGNEWTYIQTNNSTEIHNIIKRQITSKDEDKYYLSGIDYFYI